VLPNHAFYEFINRIYMQDLVTGYPCGGAGEPCDAELRPYYRPGAVVTRQQMAKFIDNARRLPEIRIEGSSSGPLIQANNSSAIGVLGISSGGTGVSGSSGSGYGVYGFSTSEVGVVGESASGVGVKGQSSSDYGVHGQSTDYIGVYGQSNTSTGVVGESTDYIGVYGQSTDDIGMKGVSGSGIGVNGWSTNGYGVWGHSATNYSGYFTSDIYVGGNCTGCAGPTRIDHPLDPENKYLSHSSVESPDMKTIYDGVVTLDANGEAEVVLPEWFEALNKEYRYQLTTIGGFAPAHIAEKIKNNRFKIAGGSPGMEVSWMVTGIRHDPYANAHPIPVEEDKPADEQGKYLHPTEYGQPESLGVDYDMLQESRQQLANP
jgi:hypothetical protein